MKEPKNANTTISLLKKRLISFFSKNGKLLGQIVLTLSFFLIGFWFIKEEQNELYQIKNSIPEAKPQWVFVKNFFKDYSRHYYLIFIFLTKEGSHYPEAQCY